MSVGQGTTRHKNSGLPVPQMGGQQNELYCNSLDQTAAAFELSPVCINSDSELEIHFNDVSSVAAAELSPELPSSNNSSESIVYGSVHQQVPMPVPSLDDSLNSGVSDRRFSASPDVTSSIGPEQEDCNSIANENQSIQPSEDHCTTRSDVFIAKEDDNAQESKDDQASEDCNVLEASDENQDCHECFTKNEEQEKLEPRIYTVAALWLSPVSFLGKRLTNKHKPPIYKTRGPKRSTPQLVPRARPPRKPPDREKSQDGYRG